MDGDLIPPPAYVEQEFDQKVSTALQISLSAPQLPLGGEEQWEEWNDAAFHAAAHALANHDSTGNSHSSQSSGVGSSTIFHPPEKTADGARSPGLPAVEPLRIRKKARSPSSQPKPRPSWIAETQTDTQSSASGSIRHEIPPDENEENHSSPPPPFTAVPPSVDGRPVIVMSYQPSRDSRSPSPLNSPIQTQLEIHAHVHDSVSLSRPPSRPLPVQPQPYVEQLHASNPAAYRSHRPTRQSLPTTPTLPHPRNAGQRPSTTYSPRLLQSSSIPRMDFNPYVAYGHDGGMPELPPTRHSTYSFDPNGFYKYVRPNVASLYLLKNF